MPRKPTKYDAAFALRMPKKLKTSLEGISVRERRTLNEQIVYALERWVEKQSGR